MTDRHHRNADLKDTHDLTFDEVNNGDYDETIPLASDFNKEGYGLHPYDAVMERFCKALSLSEEDIFILVCTLMKAPEFAATLFDMTISEVECEALALMQLLRDFVTRCGTQAEREHFANLLGDEPRMSANE